MKQAFLTCATAVLTGWLYLVGLAQSGASDKAEFTVVCSEVHGDMFGYRSGAPFSASWTQTITKKRPDSTTFSQVSTTKVSRDRAGRTYFEEHGWRNDGKPAPVAFWVNDPVMLLSIYWTAGSKVANVHHYPNPDSPESQMQMLKAPWTKTPWADTFCVDWPPNGEYREGAFEIERLDRRTIAGVEVDGIRAMRVLPPGNRGYLQSVTITEERWYSDELQLAVLNVVDDPRVGTNTWEVTNLERSEPSPELFRPPPGYTIRDDNPNAREGASAPISKETKP
jgi:hypothetical protein